MSYLEGPVSRHVLVAAEYNQNTSAVDFNTEMTVGQVGIFNVDGSGFDASDGATAANSKGRGIMVRLSTDNEEPGSTATLDILSNPLFARDLAGIAVKSFEYPKRHIVKLDMSAVTFVAGEQAFLNVRFKNVGALSDNRFLDVFADHLIASGGTGAAVVGAALVANWSKNFAKNKVQGAKVYMGAALTTFTSKINSASHFAVTTGSNTVTQYNALTGGATVNTTAGALSILVLIGGVPYLMTTAGGVATWTLDRPYEGTDSARLAAAAFTTSGATNMYVIADMQNSVDFNNPLRPIVFEASLRADTKGLSGLVVSTLQAGTRGNGYGPQVALVEEFALAQWSSLQWNEIRRMRTRRLETVSTKQYDTLIVTMRVNTEKYPGSVVNSDYGVEIYIPRDAGSNKTAADMFTDLQGYIKAQTIKL